LGSPVAIHLAQHGIQVIAQFGRLLISGTGLFSKGSIENLLQPWRRAAGTGLRKR
jgi:hypothetical protein